MKVNIIKLLIAFVSINSISLFFNSCNCDNNEHSLGCNLYVLEGDRIEDRIIVYCTGKELCDCYAGTYVIPTSTRHMRDGKYSEYVESANSNDDWISVKTKQIDKNKFNYWVIIKDAELENLDRYDPNLDSILQSHVYGPVDGPEQFLYLLDQ